MSPLSRLAALLLATLPAACGEVAIGPDDTTDSTDSTDSTDTDNTDVTPDIDAAIEPIVDAAPPPDAVPTFDLRMFVTPGNHYRFDVTADQSYQMDNNGWGGGDPLNPTFADSLTITLTNGTSQTYGKLGLRTVGQSTFNEWARKPNLRIDSNEFDIDLKIGGVEHFRFNNGRVGGLFREAAVLRIWDALGYRTPATNHAWVSSPTQWDPIYGVGYERPYEIIEVYKKPWCDRELEGGCVNMWEGVWNFQYVADDPRGCQLATCDNTKLYQAQALVQNTPQGAGFEAATDSIIDWDAFHSFQCLTWITGLGDGYIHNNNNLLIVERDTGKLQFYPYSSDISGGIQVWGGYYMDKGLYGVSELATGCQADATCWQHTLDRCDELLTAYEALDPAATIVQPLVDTLTDLGMLEVDPYPNDGFIFYSPEVPPTDAEDAAYIINWYANRAAVLRASPVWN